MIKKIMTNLKINKKIIMTTNQNNILNIFSYVEKKYCF